MFDKAPKNTDLDDEKDAPLREPFWDKEDLQTGKTVRVDERGNVMLEGEEKERIERGENQR